MITVYHSTTKNKADSILHKGFRETELGDASGVLVAEEIDPTDGAATDHMTIEICLDLAAEELELYAIHKTEWLDVRTGQWLDAKEVPPCRREWLIPAKLLNNYAKIRLLGAD